MRAVDVFILLANFIIVVAHFIGVLTCIWILNRLQHDRPRPTWRSREDWGGDVPSGAGRRERHPEPG